MSLSEITKKKDKIEYDPSIMWLDYHTLLLKAKKKYYVEEKVNSSVFENKIAQHALFGKEDSSNATLFDMAIGGNVFIIYSLAENFCAYLFGEYDIFELLSLSGKDFDIIKKNYKYFVALLASLEHDDKNIENVKKHFLEPINEPLSDKSLNNIINCWKSY